MPAGVDLVEEIYRSARTLAYRGRRHSDGLAVIVKRPAAAIPDALELAQYRREYSLMAGCQLPGVAAALALEEQGGQIQLVLEDVGGRSLAEWLERRSFTPEETIDLLIQAAETLESVHARGVVHNDVNPANLVWAPESGRLLLIDFGLSSKLAHEKADAIQGTLRYLAPEQTGRLNRGVDYRADFYALGATAWHLLVGRPPFDAIQDPLALVHAQLARTLPPPHTLRPEVTPALSDVLAVLLAKDPEQRYQSVTGLVHDLRLCQSGDRFELKTVDHAVRFAVPDCLYGRENERQVLLDSWTQVRRGGRVVVQVSGPAGVGKSSLVAELLGPVLESRGAFASGRHEQLKRDQPYQALITAVRSALRQLLSESEAELAAWRTRLTAAVGKNSGLLARPLPELTHFLEELHDIPELSSAEARTRTHLAVTSLVRALARSSRPLVLFLDDLQWADGASLELLEFLARDPESEGLLLIAGTRGGDLGLEGPRLVLTDLDEEQCGRLVADTCRCTPAEAAPLAQLLHRKTAGNPFFLRTLLLRLQSDGLLRPAGARWSWDLEAVQGVEISANVVSLMVGRIRELPAATGAALRMAAAFGHRFSLGWLAAALDLPAPEVAAHLWPALERELILPQDGAYRLVEFGSPEEAWYRFGHDRVQEAAYELLPESERPATHLALGRLLLEQGSDQPFDIMDHLGRGLEVMHDPNERARFADLALQAGLRAQTAAAFDTASALLEAGCRALGEDGWERHYPLRLALVTESAQAALAEGHQEILQQRLIELETRAASFAERIPAWTMRLQWHLQEGRMADAYQLSDDFLHRVGRAQPRTSSLPQVAFALLRTRLAIGRRTPEELLKLPQTDDPVLKGIQAVQTLAAVAQSRVVPGTIPLGILRDVRTVLADGLTANGTQCWTGYGLILCKLGQVPLGLRYGQLAMDQVEHLQRPDIWPRVACLAYLLVMPWGMPLQEISSLLHTVSKRALEVGDGWSSSQAAVMSDTLQFFGGASLRALGQRLERTERSLKHLRRAENRIAFAFLRRLVEQLSGAPAGSPSWLGESLQMDWTHDPPGQVSLRTLELLAAQIYGQPRRAWELAATPCAGLRSPTVGRLEVLDWTYALVALLRGVEEGWTPWSAIRGPLRQGRSLLQKWSRHVEGRRYRVVWVEAAEMRARGRVLPALAAYDRACSQARQGGFLQDAALIAEQAAEFGQKIGQPRLAEGYRTEAFALYRQWGALSKAAPAAPDSGSSSTGSRVLDLETVLRASRLLSSEIRLPVLLSNMLGLALENAGAERGWLILRSGENWVLADGQVLDLDDPSSPLPSTVLRYTARTREPLVLEDAGRAALTRADPYVQAHAPRSLLCLPLEHGKRLAGLLYLENNRAPGMFTPQRTEVLRTLSGQMAISIENARHFAQVEAQHDQILAAREERHLEQLRGQALEARKDALAAFLGIASHDLKNPLAAISMWAQQLEAGVVRNNIDTACRRASSLIGTYLDVVAMETGGQLKLNRRSCDLGNLVEDEIDFLLQSLGPAERARAALEWEIQPLVASVDPERMQQVIGNLVGNALKYCPPGTPIVVSLEISKGMALLAVSDDGPGLSAEMQVGLFQPFERRTRDMAGTGLGLWICRVIVEAHGGRLGLQSEVGRGSRFWCEIPL